MGVKFLTHFRWFLKFESKFQLIHMAKMTNRKTETMMQRYCILQEGHSEQIIVALDVALVLGFLGDFNVQPSVRKTQ
jgi:hypothetical protein